MDKLISDKEESLDGLKKKVDRSLPWSFKTRYYIPPDLQETEDTRNRYHNELKELESLKANQEYMNDLCRILKLLTI